MTPPPEIEPDFMPAPELRVADAETLKAISDPTRMRVLEVMVTRQDPPWSVKELAAVLGVPQTRLYHHIELLGDRGLLKAVEQRVVSGIIETRYRVAARSFQLDRRLFAGNTDETREVLSEMLSTVFDGARADLEDAVRADQAQLSGDAPAHRRVLLSRGIGRLSPERAELLHKRLQELQAEFDDEDAADDAAPYGLVVAFYPLAPLPEA